MARPIKHKGQELSTTGQSNYLTTAKYNYSAQEKRILYRVVEQAWNYVQENKINLSQRKVADIVVEDKSFFMPITAFMNSDQLKNRGGTTDKEVYEAFLSLKEKDISGYNSVNGTWMVASIVNSAYRMRNGMVRFSVAFPVWQSALDFSSGWSPMDLTVAMELKSAYSMRFFEISRKYHDTNIWNVSIETFRETFGCADKYSALYDMKRYIIENAKKELDKYSPWSFTYEQRKEGNKVTGFVFHFYQNPKCQNTEKEHKKLLSSNPGAALPAEIKNWLHLKMGLNQKQINNNIVMLDKLYSIFRDGTIQELEESFQYISRQGCRPQENVGWFIQNLKKKVENAETDAAGNGSAKVSEAISMLSNKFKK